MPPKAGQQRLTVHTQSTKMSIYHWPAPSRRPTRPVPPGETRRLVPCVRKRIPAFKGTAGMPWEDALYHTVKEDVQQAEVGHASLRRNAIRQRWMAKMIQKLDDEYEKEQMKQMVGDYYSALSSFQLLSICSKEPNGFFFLSV